MHKGKIFALLGMAILGGVLYLGFQTLTFAQTTPVLAPEAHTSCLPTKDYPNSNGYTESYTRPNNCHSKKVFFSNGSYYRNTSNWRVRCPSGTTTYIHSRAHYMMSPTLDGDYDGAAGGGAHYYCADANGNQVDYIPGESETNPFHTHTLDALAKVDVVDSDTDYYYSFKSSKWVTCQGGVQGPFPQDQSWADIQYGHIPNHFHCKNPNYGSGSVSDNPEGVPVALSPAPLTSLVGSISTSTTDTGTAKDQFVDKGPWGAVTPLGTVACVHTNSDKVYFSTTGTCPAASQFPLKPTYASELTKLSFTGNATAGAPVSLKFSLKNTSTATANFPIYCDSGLGSFTGNLHYTNIDGTTGAEFYNPGAFSGSTSSPSGNIDLTTGTTKNFEFKFNTQGTGAVGTWTVKCYTYPLDPQTRNQVGDKKEIQETFTITAATITSGNSTGVLNPQTQIGANKYTITVSDPDGLKSYSFTKKSGSSIYGGTPSACPGTQTSATVTLESSDFPLNASVTDCRAGAGAYTFPVPVPGSTPTTGWVKHRWTFTDSSEESNILNRTDREYLDFIASVDALCSKTPRSNFTWKFGAGDDSATNWRNFGIPECSGGTAVGTTTPPSDNQARACAPGETCPKGSWCQAGTGQMMPVTTMMQQCYYPDERFTCVSGPMPTGAAWTPLTCPSGTSMCQPNDKSCKQKGDSWTAEQEKALGNSNNFYCSNSRKCTLSSGGICVGMNETCPAGTKYCSSMPGSSTNTCGEPDSYTPWTKSDNQTYFMCGAGDPDFHSATTKQAYCPSTKPGGYMSWDSASIKSVLNKLGTGWSLCEAGDTKCIEPGKTGPSDGWCGWWPPNTGMMSMSPLVNGGTRTCPSLDTVITPTPEPKICPTIATPACGTGEKLIFGENGCYTGGGCAKIEVKECKAGEMPPGTNGCTMPSYRWNLAGKKWEKCDLKNTWERETAISYMDVMNDPKATHTSCQFFFFEIEEEWKTRRYLVRPPEKYGEWYTPAWDASARMLQYSPKTDQFEECRKDTATAVTPAMGNGWYSPCTPVPAEDEKWLLLKSRAEFKMHEFWKKQTPPIPPHLPGEPPIPPLPIPVKPIPPPTPVIPVGQCKIHLVGLRNTVNADKRFWKETKRQVDEVSQNYADADTVKILLENAKNLIVEIEKLVKTSNCSAENLTAIQTKSDTLHQEIFGDISGYLADIQDAAQYGKCSARLDEQAATLKKLLAQKGVDEETKSSIAMLIKSIQTKKQELAANQNDFEYDVRFECEEFARSLESQMAPLRLGADEELNRIVEEVVSEKFKPVLEQLTAQLENKGKQLDELMVQIAELHKAVDSVSTAANQISEKIAISYTAFARIEEKFAEEKAEIQTAKDRLIPLVGQAISLMKETSCVRGPERENMVQEFGTVASVNWFGERADELERRLNVFIASCRAKDVATGDLTAFHASIGDASAQNLNASYEAGLTPFKDVPTHEWYFSGMLTGYKSGFITQGRPGENVLRQDALLMVLRATGVGNSVVQGECAIPASSGITDVSQYARCAVLHARAQGLNISGSMTMPVQRIEVARWIAALSKLPNRGSDETLKAYTDIRHVPGLELDAVRSVVASGVMVGQVGSTVSTFQPYIPLTRSALAVMLEKLLPLSTSAQLPK